MRCAAASAYVGGLIAHPGASEVCQELPGKLLLLASLLLQLLDTGCHPLQAAGHHGEAGVEARGESASCCATATPNVRLKKRRSAGLTPENTWYSPQRSSQSAVTQPTTARPHAANVSSRTRACQRGVNSQSPASPAAAASPPAGRGGACG